MFSPLISVQSELEQTKQQVVQLKTELKKEQIASEGARHAFRLAVDDCFDLSERILVLEEKLNEKIERSEKVGIRKENKSKSVTGFLPSLLKSGTGTERKLNFSNFVL